jgi:peptide/nickel transport system ATP-binding protein
MAGTGTAHLRDANNTLLRVENLTVSHKSRHGPPVQAVSGISLDVLEGETLGLVGESGCGKSTVARAIIHLPPPTSGSVVFQGEDLTMMKREQLRQVRPSLQMVGQDPLSSLNPRRTVEAIVSEALVIWDKDSAQVHSEKVDTILRAVGLDPATVRGRRPPEFSGGQCQRIAIARALVLEPRLVICDEPVSALDVSVQAQILNLLEEMKSRYKLTMVFISHDLAVVKNISDRVAVMYLGKLCEIGPVDRLYAAPGHHYTRALLSAIPEYEVGSAPKQRVILTGEPPSPMSPPTGCRFRTRCPRAEARCADEEPQVRLLPGSTDHFVACHFPLEEERTPVSVAPTNHAEPVIVGGTLHLHAS